MHARASRSASLLAALLLLSFASGCETVVDVELPDHTPQLVVNDLFVAGESWRVSVTPSRGIQEAPDREREAVENATVLILSGGEVVDSLALEEAEEPRYGTGPLPRYYSPAGRVPAPGTAYTVRARAPGYAPAEATGRAPSAVPFSALRDAEDGRSVRFTLTLTDPDDRANYYALFAYRVYTADDGESELRTQMLFESPSPLLRENFGDALGDDASVTYRYALFGDASFQGETRSLAITITAGPPSANRPDRWEIVLASLSEASYEYQRTAELSENAEDNPFAEPVQVFSNVRGGLGIFAGETRFVRAVRPPRD